MIENRPTEFAQLNFRAPEHETIYREDGSYTEDYVKRIIDDLIIAIPNNNVEMLASAKGRRHNQVTPRVPSLPEGIAFLAAPEVNLEPEAIPHEGSGAHYIISAEKGNYFRIEAPDGRQCMIFLWGMKPGDSTSKRPHIHGYNPINQGGVYERHIAKAGSFTINGKKISAENRSILDTEEVPDYEVVSPGNTHQAIAGEKGAVVAILLENVEGIPDVAIHEYLEAA